jgi:hypothetical protein
MEQKELYWSIYDKNSSLGRNYVDRPLTMFKDADNVSFLCECSSKDMQCRGMSGGHYDFSLNVCK